VVPLDASGPELDPETVRGVQIAVTGKIELAGGTPQITIKSTTQIVPRTALRTNYIGRAYDKQQQGDIDGAIADLERAIEHQPDRRDEAALIWLRLGTCERRMVIQPERWRNTTKLLRFATDKLPAQRQRIRRRP